MEGKVFDFEERTLLFAKRVFKMSKVLPENAQNRVLISQVLRSAGSIGANYREANDSLGDKDFLHRLRISRKEAKETIYWLSIIMEVNISLAKQLEGLFTESIELSKILSSMIINRQKK